MGRQPIWTAIAAELKREIAEGHYTPGARLPSEAVLSSRFGVHRHTIRRALAGLARESLVLSRQGAGVFVVPPPIDITVRRGARRPLDLAVGETGERWILVLETRAATADERRRMQLPSEAEVHLLEALVLADRAAVGLLRSQFPAARFPDLPAALRRAGTVAGALAACGVRRCWRCSVRLSAQLASRTVAKRLGVEEAAALLVLDTVDVDARGRPLESRRTWFPADRVSLTLARE